MRSLQIHHLMVLVLYVGVALAIVLPAFPKAVVVSAGFLHVQFSSSP